MTEKYVPQPGDVIKSPYGNRFRQGTVYLPEVGTNSTDLAVRYDDGSWAYLKHVKDVTLAHRPTTEYTPRAGDLIEVTDPSSRERVRAFVHKQGDTGWLRIQYASGGWEGASNAIDPVLLDRKPAPWPTTPGSTARLTVDGGCDHWAVLTPTNLSQSRTHWATEYGRYRTEAEMRADGWVPVHDAGGAA